jgi:hypothetical protein
VIIVPVERTPLDETEAAFELLEAMPDLDQEQAALLLSLIWVETGGGGLNNHNPGNVTANDRWPGRAWRPPWFAITEESSDRMKRLHQLMLQGKAPKAFRAFTSAKEGFEDFAKVLRRDFPALLTAASTGDVRTFREQLARKYSADYTPAHDRALTQFRDRFRPLVSHLTTPIAPVVPVPNGEGAFSPFLLMLALRALG